MVLGIYSLREVGPHFAVLFLEKLIGSGLSEKLKDYSSFKSGLPSAMSSGIVCS